MFKADFFKAKLFNRSSTQQHCDVFINDYEFERETLFRFWVLDTNQGIDNDVVP